MKFNLYIEHFIGFGSDLNNHEKSTDTVKLSKFCLNIVKSSFSMSEAGFSKLP